MVAMGCSLDYKPRALLRKQELWAGISTHSFWAVYIPCEETVLSFSTSLLCVCFFTLWSLILFFYSVSLTLLLFQLCEINALDHWLSDFCIFFCVHKAVIIKLLAPLLTPWILISFVVFIMSAFKMYSSFYHFLRSIVYISLFLNMGVVNVFEHKSSLSLKHNSC